MSIAPAPSRASRSAEQVARPASKRQVSLEIVHRRATGARRRRLMSVLSCAVVSLSLFAVVIGHAVLAQDQVRLARVEAALTAAQLAHRSDVLKVAELESPGRIVNEAEATLHMVPSAKVAQLPRVTLDVPLGTPAVSPPPAGTSSVTAHPGG